MSYSLLYPLFLILLETVLAVGVVTSHEDARIKQSKYGTSYNEYQQPGKASLLS
jgi:hypothetical protein